MNKPEHRSVVLVVDDHPNNIHLLGAILRKEHRILYATNGRDALATAQNDHPDLILLDIQMPDMDGFQVCEQLKSTAQTRHIPVILVTGMVDTDSETRGFACGAVDFLTKPVNPPVVQAKVRTQLLLQQQRDELAQTKGLLLLETAERQRLEGLLQELTRREE